jgi:hypothetical protein
LWAKWVGSLSKARGIALGALAVPLVGVLAEGISWLAVVPLMLAAFVFVACAASFGLWLSVRARTVQRATGLWLLIVGLWVGGTLLAADAAYMEEQAQPWTRRQQDKPPPLFWDRALNPLLAWSQLTFRLPDASWSGYGYNADPWRDGEVTDVHDVVPSLIGIVVYAILAWAIFQLAAGRFEREGNV